VVRKHGHLNFMKCRHSAKFELRDSFPRRKFENRAQTSCRPGHMLSLPTISFKLYAKTAEEIDLEKCDFRNFTSSMTLTLDRVEVILVCISGRSLSTNQIRAKSKKNFLWTDGCTDTPDFSKSIRTSPR